MTVKHFHEGELRLQNQVGMREKIDVLTKHLMWDHMPDQHREFFEGLEYIFLGTVDQAGLPHATILTGPQGFASSPDPKTLTIRTDDRTGLPAFDGLAIGQPVGVLGLDLSNRRRNRMHGRVSAIDDGQISITVVQSYGNCPKYISLRDISVRNLAPAPATATPRPLLEAADIDLIGKSDTFFIASYVQDGSGAPYEGVDVNHRGGQPGFVSVDSATQITIPDYRGNDLYNTFGNLLLNPDAALLFIDFETGDQLHMHGTAALIEDSDAAAAHPGALRLLQVTITSVTRRKAATGLRWQFIETSPVSPDLSQH
ncbi:pyridoxamine 5'-phosphate oxidase family protein [uncultured Tateyamaria sp.]|uniref:pyridoxamine 5'-phosphate oxidase family protein n=1 Tax=uncultured Tateyamaria sp. TaxID=455651 RepID=UPI00261C3F3A|nr:pyridoxamine 5'-phosphate oxidase family protein [uncultured Tateyamaria sp.]